MIWLESLVGEGTDLVGGAVSQLNLDWSFVLIGIVLIIATVVIILVLKRIIINSILGIAAWAVLVFVLKIEMSFFPTLATSAIFGLAGVGVILVLKFLGIAI